MDDTPRANGALILQEREALEAIVGADTVRRALARGVPREVREAYETLTAATRIPADYVEQVYFAVAEEAGLDPLQMHRDVVRTGVDKALKSIWRVMLRFTSDAAIVRRAPLFFGRGLSKGTLQAQMIGPGEAEVRLTGWPGVPRMQINGIEAAIQVILECAGRRHVEVSHDRTLDGCRVLVRWAT